MKKLLLSFLILINGIASNCFAQANNPVDQIYKNGFKIKDIEKFLSEGNDVNQRTSKDNRTLLHWAALLGRDDIIKKILATGNAEINAQDSYGYTPLMLALIPSRDELLLLSTLDLKMLNNDYEEGAKESDRYDVLLLLLNNQADPNIKDKKGKTALNYAIKIPKSKSDSIRVFSLLRTKGAQISDESKPKFARWAIKIGNLALLKKLLDQGTPINSIDKYGNTLLHLAAATDNEKIIEELVNRGVDVTQKNENGESPILKAITRSKPNINIVKFLLTGSEINDTDLRGNTLLQNAIQQYIDDASTETLEAIKLLLDNGAQINLINSAKNTPLTMVIRAVKKCHFSSCIDNYAKLISLLLSFNVDTNIQIDGFSLIRFLEDYANSLGFFYSGLKPSIQSIVNILKAQPVLKK